ncbi:MAG: hypothetical protein ACRENG_31015 [bacterium]
MQSTVVVRLDLGVEVKKILIKNVLAPQRSERRGISSDSNGEVKRLIAPGAKRNFVGSGLSGYPSLIRTQFKRKEIFAVERRLFYRDDPARAAC